MPPGLLIQIVSILTEIKHLITGRIHGKSNRRRRRGFKSGRRGRVVRKLYGSFTRVLIHRIFLIGWRETKALSIAHLRILSHRIGVVKSWEQPITAAVFFAYRRERGG